MKSKLFTLQDCPDYAQFRNDFHYAITGDLHANGIRDIDFSDYYSQHEYHSVSICKSITITIAPAVGTGCHIVK